MKSKIFIFSLALSLFICPSGQIFAQEGEADLLAEEGEIDFVPPNEVTNVHGALNGTSVTLGWDQTLDNTGEEVESYKIYSSTKSIIDNSGDYDQPIIETEDNSTEYTIADLQPGTKYYFTITAIDKSGNESISFGQPEVILTTEGAAEGDDVMEDDIGDDGDKIDLFGTFDEIEEDIGEEEDMETIIPMEDEDTPTVISAAANDQKTISVIFSEEIVLPTENPESAFIITEAFDKTKELVVYEAVLDENDETKVKLTTDPQIKGVSYTITASADITDKLGNPIASGITDSASFEGVEVEVEKIPESEEIKSAVDITPPEEVTNFLISFEKQLNKFLLRLSWTPSINSAKDLIDQILYTSFDRGKNYDKGKSLGKTTSSHELQNMEGGKEYTFKLTTKDDAGNESTGVIKSIRLPQTGPIISGALLLSSLIAGGYALRKRKKK